MRIREKTDNTRTTLTVTLAWQSGEHVGSASGPDAGLRAILEEAVEVAEQAEVKRLALFHHDPEHPTNLHGMVYIHLYLEQHFHKFYGILQRITMISIKKDFNTMP